MKKVKKEERHVIVVLDSTGSMAGRKGDTLGGLNQFIAEQKKDSSGLFFSLTLFNSEKIEEKYKKVKIVDVKELTDADYIPNFYTPLWDAVGRTITSVPKDDKGVMFVIITDGEENASSEFKAVQVRELVKEKEALGWKFIYLGVDISKFMDSAAMGIVMGSASLNSGGSTGAVGAHGPAGYRGAMQNLCGSVADYAKTGNVTWKEPNKDDDLDASK